MKNNQIDIQIRTTTYNRKTGEETLPSQPMKPYLSSHCEIAVIELLLQQFLECTKINLSKGGEK